MWLLVFLEYFKISNTKALLINFSIAALICVSIFYYRDPINFAKYIDQFVSNSTSVLSLLVGFTVAMFTLLITASNPNIDEIKTVLTEFVLYNEKVSIYKMLLIKMVYIILIESILLLFNLLYPFFFEATTRVGKIFFGIDAFLTTHIILANINNTVDLYFVLTKKNN
ncbi:hypothetical protein BC343_29290 [Mucilaginibacter pedocola]|uniref:Uncharacterized protein n=1 Tax=Mucilaginibacter pedocola TaxID=1792845 RepID=A0A1S9PDW5_9SPHI|nr:hypothetical protein BC343_29290 [Mucilaginibacter pedocola]